MIGSLEKLQRFEASLGLYLEETLYDPTKFSFSTGDDPVLDDIFSYQICKKMKNNWRGAVAPANIQAGMIWSDSDDDKLYHHGAADEEILQAIRSADVSPLFMHLGLGGAATDVDVGINFNEVMTDVDNSIKVGIWSYFQVKKTAAAMTSYGSGISGGCILDSTNTQNWTHSRGLSGIFCSIITEAGSAGTVTGAACLNTYADIADAATVTNLYGLYVSTPGVAGNKVTNEYGIYVVDQNTGLTLNYAMYTNAGLVSLGDNLFLRTVKSGATQGAAGAAANEVWKTSGHAHLEDNVLMIGA